MFAQAVPQTACRRLGVHPGLRCIVNSVVQVSVESLTVKSIGEAESAGLWGLDRIDQKTDMRDYLYHYSYVGTGVHVYTVDTVSAVSKLCTPSYHGGHSQSCMCTCFVMFALHMCKVGLA